MRASNVRGQWVCLSVCLSVSLSVYINGTSYCYGHGRGSSRRRKRDLFPRFLATTTKERTTYVRPWPTSYIEIIDDGLDLILVKISLKLGYIVEIQVTAARQLCLGREKRKLRRKKTQRNGGRSWGNRAFSLAGMDQRPKPSSDLVKSAATVYLTSWQCVYKRKSVGDLPLGGKNKQCRVEKNEAL